MLIYGSQAIKHFFSNYERECKDVDMICKPDEEVIIKSNLRIEKYWISEFEYIFQNNLDPLYVDPNFLYTIKASHLAWDIRWDKHMHDLIFLQEQGCKLDMQLFKDLYSRWQIIHSKKKVKMNVKNEEFFKENIYRKYDHDYLHTQVMFYDRPLNEKLRENLDSPYCSENLWNYLSEDDKLKCALEEIHVLALERYLLRPVDRYTVSHAVVKMLKHMIVSTTSGWFNLFLILNFNKLRKMELYRLKEFV